MIQVFGIEFKSLLHLTKLLGYSSPFSYESIKKRYGDIEGMVCTRLQVDRSEGKKALQAYLDRMNSRPETEKSMLLKSVIRAAINAFICNDNNIKLIASSQNRILTDNDLTAAKNALQAYLETFQDKTLY